MNNILIDFPFSCPAGLENQLINKLMPYDKNTESCLSLQEVTIYLVPPKNLTLTRQRLMQSA